MEKSIFYAIDFLIYGFEKINPWFTRESLNCNSKEFNNCYFKYYDNYGMRFDEPPQYNMVQTFRYLKLLNNCTVEFEKVLKIISNLEKNALFLSSNINNQQNTETMKNIKKWSIAETSSLKSLLATGKTNTEIAKSLGRSINSINDKVYRVNAENLKRHNAPWTIQEDKNLLAGMDNKKFAARWHRGLKEINQRRFDLKNNKVIPGQNLGVVSTKKSVTPSNSTLSTTGSTRAENKLRTIKTSFTQKEFRETVIELNKKMFNVPDGSSGNPSTYQYGIMNSIQGLKTNSTNETRLGNPQQESRVVLIAFDLLIAKYNA